MSKTEKAQDIIRFMAMESYKQWYRDDVAPNLTDEQKNAIMRRISDMTLEEAIWLDRETNFIDKFPELEPYSHNKKISGLQLVTVMESCMLDLHPEVAKSLPKYFHMCSG